MGVLLHFPPQDQLTLWAEETYRGTTVAADIRLTRISAIEWSAASLRHALGRGIYTEIADAESELREAVERVFGERR